jgi:hypothetical protein
MPTFTLPCAAPHPPPPQPGTPPPWPGLGRDLAGGHLGPVHAPGPGRHAPRPVPAARHQPGRGGAGRAAGLPAEPVHAGGLGGLGGVPQGVGADPDLPGADGPVPGVVPAVVGVPVTRGPGGWGDAGARGPRAAGRPPPASCAPRPGWTPRCWPAATPTRPAPPPSPPRVWRSGPAPGAQAPTGTRVRLWANLPDSPPRRPPGLQLPRPARPARGRGRGGVSRRWGGGRPGRAMAGRRRR